MSFKIKNFSMRAFNSDVNNSGDLDDKYKLWSAYRNDISGFIRAAAAAKPNSKSIIVFGAGECNDIDLDFLAHTFERIVLSDVDEQSIYDGMARQGLNKSGTGKIEVLQAEYTGLNNVGFFDTFSMLAGGNAPETQISSFIKNAFINVMSPNISKTLGGFDIVLGCPVYTQIVYTQAEVLLKILEEYSTYSLSDINALTKTIADSMPLLIKKYNDLLLSMSAPNGIIAVLTDIIEVHPQDDLINHMSRILSALPADTDELKRLTKAHGLKFGTLGIEDFLSKIIAGHSLWSLWPFDEYRHYLVYGVLGSKK